MLDFGKKAGIKSLEDDDKFISTKNDISLQLFDLDSLSKAVGFIKTLNIESSLKKEAFLKKEALRIFDQLVTTFAEREGR